MDYNPHKQSQSLATTKLCIEHALSHCKSQKELALELNEEQSRISEMKKGITRLRTVKAEAIFAKFGYPRGSKGRYFPRSKAVKSASELTQLIQARGKYLQSVILQDILIIYKKYFCTAQDVKETNSEIDHIFNELIFDPVFCDASNTLINEYFGGYSDFWHPNTFEIDASKLSELSLSKDSVYRTLVERIKSFQLIDAFASFGQEHVNQDDVYKLSIFVLASVAVNLTMTDKSYFLAAWDCTPCRFGHIDYVSEVSVSGITLAEADFCDNGAGRLIYFGKKKSLEKQNCLEALIYQLKKKLPNTSKYNLMELPRPLFSESDLYLKLDSVIIVYDPDTSVSKVCVSLMPSLNVTENSGMERLNLILPDVTPKELIEEVLPLINQLSDSEDFLCWETTEHSVKSKLAELGVLLPGVITI
ncbi:hypothetical protein KL866_04635 [Alteromonas sp. ALT199]|uniref:hypothetical protein n=1 Tax=unclassified Alteromonas TaxID=2614992 RepID=UPI001BEBC2D4|nr:hypothetical protein [Alteromonas sp. ALT199]MBT3134397.1 hypothetical protein [Alteromonas sp. ALT199]